MRVIWILAKTTFKEVIRDRILYALLLFALMLIGLSLALGQLSFAEQERITFNFGLSAIHLASVVLSIFIGSTLVFKEIDKRTILTILVRPLTRTQFVLGKALGLTLLILTMILGLSSVLALVLWGLGVKIPLVYVVILLGLFGESLVLLGLTLLLAMVLRPILVVCVTGGLFLIGHWQGSLNYFAEKDPAGALPYIAAITRYGLPNLERLNWKDLVLYQQDIVWFDKISDLGYGVAWALFCVSVAALLFKRKDVS